MTSKTILDQLAQPDEENRQPLEELLEPANTNSPRDTIVSFVKLTQRYYDLLRQNAYTAEDDAELQHLYDEMQWFFDLRDVAPSLRQDVAVSSAVYLREVIDRIGLPQVDQIPDRKQMLAAIGEGDPPAWKIGNSPLVITRIDEGPNQGKYVFSAETLESVEDLFWQLRSFPYRSSAAEKLLRGVVPDAAPDTSGMVRQSPGLDAQRLSRTDHLAVDGDGIALCHRRPADLAPLVRPEANQPKRSTPLA
ncbi:hypothetical protein QW131_17700 [Roseibium salinum]|nr:hypothetical protein [Roseibium salinum]